MNLVCKSREQIEHATRNKTRSELLDITYSLVTLEPMVQTTGNRGTSRDVKTARCLRLPKAV